MGTISAPGRFRRAAAAALVGELAAWRDAGLLDGPAPLARSALNDLAADPAHAALVRELRAKFDERWPEGKARP